MNVKNWFLISLGLPNLAKAFVLLILFAVINFSCNPPANKEPVAIAVHLLTQNGFTKVTNMAG